MRQLLLAVTCLLTCPFLQWSHRVMAHFCKTSFPLINHHLLQCTANNYCQKFIISGSWKKAVVNMPSSKKTYLILSLTKYQTFANYLPLYKMKNNFKSAIICYSKPHFSCFNNKFYSIPKFSL